MNARLQPLLPVIRALGPDDVDRLIAIEQAAYPYPWTRGIFADCIRVGYPCTGLQLGPDLAGYIILSWGAGECHLLNLCIHPDWQGRGHGGLLLEQGITQARTAGCDILFLEVRESNTGAERLYRRRGFRKIGWRRNYYQADGGREHAIVMELDLLA